MTIEVLVARYGLVAIFLGSGIEGEAVVIAGGVLAHKHLVPLWAAMLASATGSCIVDQLWFFVGRYCRRYRWVQAMMKKPAFERAHDIFDRHPTIFVLGFRFVYGMRTISPIAIGTTRIPTRRFLLLNAVAAAIWGPLFSWIGFQFGKAIDPLWRHIQNDMLFVGLGVLVLAVLVTLGIKLWRSRQ